MEKNRSSKVLAIVAIVLSVVGLSLGFAAFTNVLTIKSSAKVTPDESTFNVDFSSVAENVTDGAVKPELTGTATATNATISNASAPTLTGINATFKKPGDKVTFKVYAHNVGSYDAYLNSIKFNNASSVSSFKKCTAAEGTTPALVAEACNGIKLTVQVGALTAEADNLNISEHLLTKEANELVTVTLEYVGGSALADGEFNVEFGDVALTYGSAD